MTSVTSASAVDLYDTANRQLTIPSLQIGLQQYSNVVLTVGKVVSPPSGASPNGQDTYDPVTGYLTVPDVFVGAQEVFNVVVTVASLQSIGSVTNADRYNNAVLTIATVAAGDALCGDSAITGASLIGISGGMPGATTDTYNSSTEILTMPVVQAGGAVYTNVTARVSKANIKSAGTCVSVPASCAISAQPAFIGLYETVSATGTVSFWGVYCGTSATMAVGHEVDTTVISGPHGYTSSGVGFAPEWVDYLPVAGPAGSQIYPEGAIGGPNVSGTFSVTIAFNVNCPVIGGSASTGYELAPQCSTTQSVSF
jgi:hypothetical protein